MNSLPEATNCVANISHRNRNRILMGVGVLALAGLAVGIGNHIKTRRQAFGALTRKKAPQRGPLNPDHYGHKKDMYKAPAMASENLAKH